LGTKDCIVKKLLATSRWLLAKHAPKVSCAASDFSSFRFQWCDSEICRHRAVRLLEIARPAAAQDDDKDEGPDL